jgi:hypothetical protein
MPHRPLSAPFAFFFLTLPYGISQGYVTVTLPFMLTKAGVPVATTAGIVAIGISANLWSFLGGPIVDMTLVSSSMVHPRSDRFSRIANVTRFDPAAGHCQLERELSNAPVILFDYVIEVLRTAHL